MKISVPCLFAVAALLAVSSPLSARQDVLADAGTVAAASTAAAAAAPDRAPAAAPDRAPAGVLAPTAAGVALLTPGSVRSVESPLVPAVFQQARSQNVTLMIVGGAGLVVGSLVGGDAGTIIMVGSGVIGFVGLYRYLQ